MAPEQAIGAREVGDRADVYAAGVLLFRLEAATFLFPLVQAWPTGSPTAETMLVRREGDQVLFLNELRHLHGTAMNLRHTVLVPGTLTAAMAARPRNGQRAYFFPGSMPWSPAAVKVARKVILP